MLNFNDEYVSFTRNNAKYEVKKPSQVEIDKYNKDLKAAKKTETEEVLLSFLEGLGLPRETFSQLNVTQSKILLTNLYESEKN
jgi:hypothetical protein